MTKQIFLLSLFLFLALGCSKDEDPPVPEPEPLTVDRMDAFVYTGPATFQVTNLLANPDTEDIRVTSPFIVVFSRPVLATSLGSETLPRLMRTENGEAVAGIGLMREVSSDRELVLSPTENLEPGTTYQLVLNPGYEAVDGGFLEEHVIVNFTTTSN